MDATQARSVIEGGIACVNARDIEGMLELVHPDARWYAPSATAAPAYEGLEGVRQFVTEWLEVWEGFHQELFGLELRGDRGLARVLVRARGESSGVEIDLEIGYLVRFMDAKLLELELVTSYEEALKRWETLS